MGTADINYTIKYKHANKQRVFYIMKSKAFRVLFVCLLCILLAGCNANVKTTKKDNLQKELEKGKNQGTSNESISEEISLSSKVKKMKSMKLESIPIYKSQSMEIDGDMLYNLLMGDAQIVNRREEVMEVNGQEQLYKYYEASDGRTWSSYGNTNVNYMKGKYKSIAVDFEIDYAKPYLRKQEFDFASREEAETEIESLLKSLNINYSEDYEYWGIDYEWLKEKNSFDGAVAREWDESLNCYLFRYMINIDSYPLMTKIAQVRGIEGVQTSFVGTKPCIMFVYSESGIDQIKFTELLEADSVERLIKTINFDQVIQNAVKELSAWEFDSQYQIDDLCVEYYPIENDGMFILKPMCRVTAFRTDQMLSDTGQVESVDYQISLIYDGESGDLCLEDMR